MTAASKISSKRRRRGGESENNNQQVQMYQWHNEDLATVGVKQQKINQQQEVQQRQWGGEQAIANTSRLRR